MKIRRYNKRNINKEKPILRDIINNNLQIISTVVTILGISLISVLVPFKNSIPFIQRNTFEDKIEKIKVTQSKEYIDNIINPPIRTESIEYILYNNDIEIGERSFYNSKYFFVVAYYRLDKSLLGYFIVSKHENFNPKLYRNTSIFSNFFKNNKDAFGGYLDMISYGRGCRRDLSQYYIEFYYHHLATNSCYIGIGISDLGYWKDNYQRLINEYSGDIGLVQVNNDNNIKLTENSKQFSKVKPNSFSVFYNRDVNIYELLSKELNFGLALSHIEYDLLIE